MLLNLLVIRARDVDALGRFYSSLGMTFLRERHGAGPEHLACSMGGTTIELYPSEGSIPPPMRLGFRVDDVSSSFTEALARGAQSVSSPRMSQWGERAVIRDPEGNTVELLRPAERELHAA
ncbi:VOC family protein [Bosea sp. CCNWLW174]|uniref:VOC family protein n=1 Tax=unclassified Bosea (in: a-proteobacteria) TaxID=2653178 RepID=UPI0030148529